MKQALRCVGIARPGIDESLPPAAAAAVTEVLPVALWRPWRVVQLDLSGRPAHMRVSCSEAMLRALEINWGSAPEQREGGTSISRDSMQFFFSW